MSQFNILVGVSGSIAAFKAAALVSKLAQNSLFNVQVAMSEHAEKFVSSITFEALSKNPVFSDEFQLSRLMDHISLVRKADLFLIYPASANTVNQMGLGLSQNVIGTLFLAHDFKTPIWICPSMNQAMIKHPTVQGSFSRLQEWGVKIVFGEVGSLACGEEGEGRVIEPEALFQQILNLVSQRKSK